MQNNYKRLDNDETQEKEKRNKIAKDNKKTIKKKYKISTVIKTQQIKPNNQTTTN